MFFHYGEDDNYANRALYKGFKIGIIINTIIQHDKAGVISAFHSNKELSFKRDSTIFLNQASDPRQSSYKILIIKRFLRYSFFSFINFLSINKKAMRYNFSMAKFTISSYKKIKKSRSTSIKSKTPYLN